MKLLLAFIFVSSLLIVYYTEAIMYGKFISIRDAPYFVSLLDPMEEGNVYACGGAIISEHWVVTAAHCIDNHTRIIAGASIINKENSSSIYGIEKIFVHGTYPDAPTYYHDIALIKLKDPVKFDEYQQPIKIKNIPPRENDTVVVVGFGDQGGAKDFPPVLRQTEVVVVDQTTCDYVDQPYWSEGDTAFCAGNGATDACSGDSGGPAVIDGQLAGVVSWGPDCKNYRDQDHKPGHYTRVDAFYDWILEVTRIVY